MQRKFVTNLVFLLFVNFLVKPFWILGIDREVQNLLGNKVYGEYFILFNFSLLLNILLDLGITNFNNRNIAQNRQLLGKHFSGILALKILLGVLYLVITIVAAVFLQFSDHRLKLLLFLAFNQFLVSFILYLRSNISGLHLFKTDSLISVLDRVLMITFCALLIWGHIFDSPFNISWFIYAQTLSYLLTATVAFLIVHQKATFKKINWNRLFIIVMLKKGMPFALLVLLMTFYNRMDSVMLDLLLPNGERESGLYAQGYRLLDAVNMIGFLTAGLLYPMFAYMIKHKKDVASLVKLSFGLLAAIAIPLAIVSYKFSFPIISMLYDGESHYSAGIFSLLMIAFIPVSMSYIFGTLLTANGSLKLLNIIAIGGVILNLVLNYIFIPLAGAFGSAATTLVTQFFATIVQIIAVCYIFRFRPNYGLLLSFTAFTLLCIGIIFSIDVIKTGWVPQMIIALAAMILAAFLTRLLNLRSLMQILKYDRE